MERLSSVHGRVLNNYLKINSRQFGNEGHRTQEYLQSAQDCYFMEIMVFSAIAFTNYNVFGPQGKTVPCRTVYLSPESPVLICVSANHILDRILSIFVFPQTSNRNPFYTEEYFTYIIQVTGRSNVTTVVPDNSANEHKSKFGESKGKVI